MAKIYEKLRAKSEQKQANRQATSLNLAVFAVFAFPLISDLTAEP